MPIKINLVCLREGGRDQDEDDFNCKDMAYIQAKFKLIDGKWQLHGRDIKVANLFDKNLNRQQNWMFLFKSSFKKSTPLGLIEAFDWTDHGRPIRDPYSWSSYFLKDF